MDVDGNVLEMSSEPPESKITEKVKHKAYPTHEAAGFVWVYMGPPDEQPEFTAPVFQPTPDTKVSISKVIIESSYLVVPTVAFNTIFPTLGWCRNTSRHMRED